MKSCPDLGYLTCELNCIVMFFDQTPDLMNDETTYQNKTQKTKTFYWP